MSFLQRTHSSATQTMSWVREFGQAHRSMALRCGVRARVMGISEPTLGKVSSVNESYEVGT